MRYSWTFFSGPTWGKILNEPGWLVDVGGCSLAGILYLKWILTVGYVKYTPWKINMEPKNHLFEKENHLPNLHDYVPC